MKRTARLTQLILPALVALAAGALAPAAGAASGATLWTRMYDGGASAADSYQCVAKGPHGSVYVAGSCVPSPGAHSDIVVARYGADGTRAWLHTFTGPADSYDRATDVVVDGAGNLYVCGVAAATITPPGGDGVASLLVAKYSPAGILRWGHGWQGPFGGFNGASALALAGGGGILIAGTSTGMGTGTNIVLLHYDGAGALQWGGATRYVSPGGDDRAEGLAVDGDGNAYVAGSGANAAGDSDAILVKWDASGAFKWGRLYDTGSAIDDYGSGVRVTPGGAASVCGWIARTGDDLDWLLLKYTTGGALSWHKTWGSASHGADTPEAMAKDGNGNVYLTGYSYRGSYARCVTRKYTPSGALAWSRTIRKDPGIRGESIAVGGGSVYLGGFCGGASNPAMIARYSTGGTFKWLKTWRTGPGKSAYANGIAVVPGEALWVAGLAQRGGTGYDGFVQKRRP